MIDLFKFENYNFEITPEALALIPFRKIWNRDKSKDKEKAFLELSFIYFMEDPRSSYQYITDYESRVEAVKKGEGFKDNWMPDKDIMDAMEFYSSFKPTSAQLLEDTRVLIDKFRSKMKSIDFDELDIKDMKDTINFTKQIPSLIKDLDEAEKTLSREISYEAKVRGQKEMSIMDGGLKNI